MELCDSNVLERIISELNSNDLLALLQSCSHISKVVNVQQLKSNYIKRVFEYDYRNMYIGEHFALPDGTFHGPMSQYESIPKLFGSQMKLIQREYQDGICINEQQWIFCGLPQPGSVVINNNHYLPI